MRTAGSHMECSRRQRCGEVVARVLLTYALYPPARLPLSDAVAHLP